MKLLSNLFQSFAAKPAVKELSNTDTLMLNQYLESCTTVADLYRFRDVFAFFTPQMSGGVFQRYCASISNRLRVIVHCNDLKKEPYMTWELSKMFKAANSIIEVEAILLHIKRHRKAYIEQNRPDLDIYFRMADKRKAALEPLQNQSAI